MQFIIEARSLCQSACHPAHYTQQNLDQSVCLSADCMVWITCCSLGLPICVYVYYSWPVCICVYYSWPVCIYVYYSWPVYVYYSWPVCIYVYYTPQQL